MIIFLLSVGLGGICGCTAYLFKNSSWKKLTVGFVLTITVWVLFSLGYVNSELIFGVEVDEGVTVIFGTLTILLLLIFTSTIAGKLLFSLTDEQAGSRIFLVSSVLIFVSFHLL